MPRVVEFSPKERRFIREYTRDGNATRSAVAAGYSKKSAGQIGYQLLHKPSIANAIAQREARLAEKADIDAAELLKLMAVRARADIGDVLEWENENGIRLLPSDEIDTRIIKSISQMETTTTKTSKSGDEYVTVTRRHRVEIHDVDKAQKELGEHLGVLPRSGTVEATGAGNQQVFKAYPIGLLDLLPKPNAPPADDAEGED